MTYDSESVGSDKSSDNATNTEEEAWKSGCRDLIIIDNLNNSKSNIKEHKLNSNNLDTALDLFQPKTSTFSTRALIWVHFKTVRYFSQQIFRLFSYFKNA